ncbi:MAG: hypothetical protein IKM07_01090, partial [Clostridia bacterium]|nr:hypothetical protein [Clostridia bacterium]
QTAILRVIVAQGNTNRHGADLLSGDFMALVYTVCLSFASNIRSQQPQVARMVTQDVYERFAIGSKNPRVIFKNGWYTFSVKS